MGVWDEPRSIPDFAPPGAGAGCDRERAITCPSCFRSRLRRPKPHDTSVQANLWPDTRSLDGPHNRLVARDWRESPERVASQRRTRRRVAAFERTLGWSDPLMSALLS